MTDRARMHVKRSRVVCASWVSHSEGGEGEKT